MKKCTLSFFTILLFSSKIFCQTELPFDLPSVEIKGDYKKGYNEQLTKVDKLLVGKWISTHPYKKGYVEFKNDMMFDGMNAVIPEGNKYMLHSKNSCKIQGAAVQKDLEATEALAWMENAEGSCYRIIKIDAEELIIGFRYKSSQELILKRDK